jgi:hypothetical protein
MLGELAQLSCIHEHEKEYRGLLARRLDQDQLEAGRRGVILEGGQITLGGFREHGGVSEWFAS